MKKIVLLITFVVLFSPSHSAFSAEKKKGEIYSEKEFNGAGNVKHLLPKFEDKRVTVTLLSGATFVGTLNNLSQGEFIRLQGSPTDYYDTLINHSHISAISFEARSPNK